MKPSELVLLFAFHPAYNPAGILEGSTISYRGTRYLCCVPEHLGKFAEHPSYTDLREFRDQVDKKLQSLDASVLANHFRYNLGIGQTLANSREFWVNFAEELKLQHL